MIDWEKVFSGPPRAFTADELDAAYSYKTCAVGTVHPHLVEDKCSNGGYYHLKEDSGTEFFRAGGQFFSILWGIDDNQNLSDEQKFVKAKELFEQIKRM